MKNVGKRLTLFLVSLTVFAAVFFLGTPNLFWAAVAVVILMANGILVKELGEEEED